MKRSTYYILRGLFKPLNKKRKRKKQRLPMDEENLSFSEIEMEDYILHNWKAFTLFENYKIVRSQYPTDTGRIDILAKSKDKKEILVIELKKGVAKDAAVGQVLRYMGYITSKVARRGQTVSGVIIATGASDGLWQALSIVPNVKFYLFETVQERNRRTTKSGRAWFWLFILFLLLLYFFQ